MKDNVFAEYLQGISNQQWIAVSNRLFVSKRYVWVMVGKWWEIWFSKFNISSDQDAKVNFPLSNNVHSAKLMFYVGGLADV